MIVATPAPSSPRSVPHAPSSSISLDALERLPSLSLSRSMRMALRVPSGRQRGTAKQDSPAGGLGEHQEQVAHRRRAEPLVPGEDVAAVGGAARVVLARTSLPPCFSVIAMPASAPRLPAAGSSRWS